MKKPSVYERDPRADYNLAATRRSAGAKEKLLEIRDQVFSQYWLYLQLISQSPDDRIESRFDRTPYRSILQKNSELLDRGRPLEGIRHDVLQSAFLAMCWMCEAASATAIDHFLPKSKFPEFSILYYNLLPICSECNTNKRDKILGPRGRFAHPHFSGNSEEYPWLDCVVEINSAAVSVTFRVLRGVQFSDEIESGFKTLKLYRKYQTLAIQEIYSLLDEIQNLGVDRDVARRAMQMPKRAAEMSNRFGAGHWKVALLNALDGCEIFWQSELISVNGYQIL